MSQVFTNATIQMLARMDALFTPVRGFDGRSQQSFHQCRVAFFSRGLPWQGGGRAANRLAVHRLLEPMRKAGLITIRRRNDMPYVRLTDAAEETARRLAGLPCIACGWLSLEEIARLSDETGREWVPEAVLAGWVPGRGVEPGTAEERELLLVQNMALPALCRGWLESNSTTSRHVAYHITPTGRKALERGDAPADDDRQVDDPAAQKCYDEVFAAERSRLMTTPPPDTQDIAPIPLSMSVHVLCSPLEAAHA